MNTKLAPELWRGGGFLSSLEAAELSPTPAPPPTEGRLLPVSLAGVSKLEAVCIPYLLTSVSSTVCFTCWGLCKGACQTEFMKTSRAVSRARITEIHRYPPTLSKAASVESDQLPGSGSATFESPFHSTRASQSWALEDERVSTHNVEKMHSPRERRRKAGSVGLQHR